MFGFPSFAIFSQLLVNGILFGAMYGIAAIGLSLIFGTMKVLFLAQGTMIVLAAYACFWLFELFGIDPYLSIIIVIPACMLFGSGLYQTFFRRIAKSGPGPSLLIAFGLLVLLENLMTVLWSADTRAIRTSYTAVGLNFLGLKISFTRFMSFIMALASALGVTFFLKKTLMGKAVRAASENIESSTLVGITPHRVNTITFAIGIGLAGFAGISTATTYGFDPYFGFVFTLKALIAVALGGMGNILGALLGGIFLGMLESMVSFQISAGWADAISYGVFLLVLLFRPEGLFTRSSGKSGDGGGMSAAPGPAPSQTVSEPSAMMKKARIAFPVLVFLALCVIPFILDSENNYIIYLLFLAFIYVALAQGWNLLAGYTGEISLGTGAFFGLGAYVVAIGWAHGIFGFFSPLGFILAGLAAAILAVAIGTPLLSRLRGDYFALGTLGLAEILKILFIQGGMFTGGPVGITLPSSAYNSFMPYYFIALFFALFATAVTYFIIKSRIGLALIAVRDDETAASASGINTLKYKILAFAAGAFIAGICGGLQAYYLFHISPDGFFSFEWTLYPILMCMLGGAGTITGPIIGAFFLTIAFELAKIWLPEFHPMFSGMLIILVVLFLPTGLVRLRFKGFFKKTRRAFKKDKQLT
ncbi:MAG: ABC transporter permease [Deltaproteobacteria bacterium]|nr:ABC transporter permease [Deltaproteobacteria bacterium]